MTVSKKIKGAVLLAILSTGLSAFAETGTAAVTGTTVMPTTMKMENKKIETGSTTKHVKMTAEERATMQAKVAADKKARQDKLAADKKAREDKHAADKQAREDKLAAQKKLRDDAKKVREAKHVTDVKAKEDAKKAGTAAPVTTTTN